MTQVLQRIDCLFCVLGVTLRSIGTVGDKKGVPITPDKIIGIRQLTAALVIGHI